MGSYLPDVLSLNVSYKKKAKTIKGSNSHQLYTHKPTLSILMILGALSRDYN